jgi:urease accessory protein UreF
MTDEERKEAMDLFNQSIRIANKFGPLIIKKAENNGGCSATAAAIMLSSFASAMGMTLHDAMSLFMSVHKQTMAMERDV